VVGVDFLEGGSWVSKGGGGGVFCNMEGVKDRAGPIN